MDRPAHIWFVRHGQSLGNVTSREERAKMDIVTTKYPLTKLGLTQAEAAGTWMQEHVPNPDAILVSDFLRARQTADALGYDERVYREEHALLGEQDFGMWYFRTEDEMLEHFPQEVRRRDLMINSVLRSFHWKPLAGDSGREIETRVWALWHDLCQRFAGKTVVLVGHGTWSTLFMKVALRWTAKFYEQNFRIWHPKNAAVMHFAAEGRSPHQLMHYDPSVDCVVPWMIERAPTLARQRA